MNPAPHAPHAAMPLRIMAAVLFSAFLLYYLSTLQWQGGLLLDAEHYILGRDFVNFWLMGKAAWLPNPEQFYAIDHYNAWLNQLFGITYRYRLQWSYPPTVMLVAAVFGLLSYALAYLLWILASIAALWLAGRSTAQRVQIFTLAICSPAALICFISGQSSLLTAALQIGAFRLMEKRPALAGCLIGLLTLKPQLGILYPILLIATRQWKAMAFATLTACGIACLTGFCFGWEVLASYWQQGAPLQANVLTHHAPITAGLMPTLFIDAFHAGLKETYAMWFQLAATSICAVMLVRMPRAHAFTDRGMVFFAAASIASTPYLLSYDMVFLSWAIAACTTLWTSRSGTWLGIACYLLPILHILAIVAGVPGTSLFPLLLAFWAWSRRHEPTIH